MKNRLFAFFKDPPLCFSCIVWAAALCFIAGSFVLMAAEYTAWPVYLVYGGAAVLLAYSVYILVRIAPLLKAKIIESARRRPFTENLLGSYGFRTLVFFSVSFAVNVAFAVFNGVLGILTRSVWYGIFACYYLALSALRGGILLGSARAKKRAAEDGVLLETYKLKLFRLCGCALFALELALAAAVTLMVLSDRPAAYSEIMAITTAAYTFYKVISAVVNVFRVRRLKDPVLQSFRNINLADAAVSLLSLQVTLVAVFSDGTDGAMNALNAVTGFAVCALTLALGVFMIVRANARLKKIKEEGFAK